MKAEQDIFTRILFCLLDSLFKVPSDVEREGGGIDEEFLFISLY
jgi:hypothetical protein